MVTTVSRLQQRLEAITLPRPIEPLAAPPTEAPSFAVAVNANRQVGWDPHEVWLDRIKRPRDERRPDRSR